MDFHETGPGRHWSLVSAVLIKKLEVNVRRLPISETLVFGYFVCHDRRFCFNDYLF